MPYGKEEVFQQPRTRPTQFPHFETCTTILEGIKHQKGYHVSSTHESEMVERAIAEAERIRRLEAEKKRERICSTINAPRSLCKS
jgi:nicotinic acid mononucleotide adenylyltransferase